MDYTLLKRTPLFRDASLDEIEAMTGCMGAASRHFQKGEYICYMGDVLKDMGIVLVGGAIIEHDDYWGNKTILGHVGPGELFGEAYACTPGQPLLVNVLAEMPTEVLFLNINRVTTTCPSGCAHHQQVIQNLMTVLAQKNLGLSRRILHTTSKSIRGRVIAYLSDQITLGSKTTVAIPYNRQQLADYLNVDRSALSNELSKMQKEGILKVEKNRFTML